MGTGLDCIDNSEYQNEICVNSSSMLWNELRTFTVYDQLCANDQPIYEFVVYNESGTEEFGGVTLASSVVVEATFYLHYQPEYLLSTDTEKTGQWMITKDEISVNYLALCRQDDLMDCIENEWKVKFESFEGNGTMLSIIMNVLDEHMSVTDGACGVGVTQEEDGTSMVSIIIVVVVVLLVIIMCVGAYFCWKRMNQNEQIRIQKAISSSGHTVPTGVGAEEAEPEVEVEVTMDPDGSGYGNTTHTAM